MENIIENRTYAERFHKAFADDVYALIDFGQEHGRELGIEWGESIVGGILAHLKRQYLEGKLGCCCCSYAPVRCDGDLGYAPVRCDGDLSALGRQRIEEAYRNGETMVDVE
jgi:hypothetical protein